MDKGYLEVMQYSFSGKSEAANTKAEDKVSEEETTRNADESLEKVLLELKKGMAVSVDKLDIKEGETTPPKRYSSGSLILAMENAGQLIEDEELRAQIKGSGIGTSATRGEILKKLVTNGYLALNKKTQIITPTLLGEIIYEVVNVSIKPLLNPELTASWEKGLTGVAEGNITSDEYTVKLNDFVSRRTNYVKSINVNNTPINQAFAEVRKYYK